MKRLQPILLALLLSSCFIWKQGVFYEEMASPPRLSIAEDNITVKTKNSVRHSALLLYKIETEVNKENKELNLRGLQAANKKPKTHFEIDLNKLGIQDLTDWSINWIDPDGTRHPLKTNPRMP